MPVVKSTIFSTTKYTKPTVLNMCSQTYINNRKEQLVSFCSKYFYMDLFYASSV